MEKMRKGMISGTVLGYLKQYPDTAVEIDAVMTGTGFDRRQVLTAFTTLRTKGYDVESVISGQVYRLNTIRQSQNPTPKVVTSSEVFEKVGVLKDNETLILQSDSGRIYRATEL